MSAQTVAPSIGRTLANWRVATAASLLVGYSGYYLCRSNFAVAAPLMLADTAMQGVDRGTIGAISSAGVLSYASGKLVNGMVGDFAGGRSMFVIGLFGSVLATIVFGFGASVTWFALAWVANRFCQSAGWGGLVKIVSNWFPATLYGSVMAVLSLSFLFGDAIGRYALGTLMARGLGWRAVFFLSAAALAVIGGCLTVTLRGSPRDVGLEEPDISPGNVFGAAGSEASPASLRGLLAPYCASPTFWLVCFISCGLTLVREAFNIWTPVYLVDAQRVSVGDAAMYSSLFPFVGGLSTLGIGWASDRVGNSRRMTLVVPSLILCTLSLGWLAIVGSSGQLFMTLAAISSVALWLLGPYSLLAGAMALDLGGRQGSATAAGLIDTAGYIGGALSGYAIGRIVDAAGWAAAFQALALVTGVTALAATALLIYQRLRGSGTVKWVETTV